jgi:small subunit ribosomal protein S3
LGQKVNPISLRLGIVKTWESRWFAGKKYADYIFEDYQIRKFIKEKLHHAGVAKIEIERSTRRVRLRIFTARPGIVIGKKGSEIEKLKKSLEGRVSQEVLIDIQEIRKPEVDAQLVAENVAMQIERRVAFRRAMKRGVSSAMRFGAQGVKSSVQGGSAAPKWPVRNGIGKVEYHFTPCGRISTTVSQKPVPLMVLSESRCLCSMAKFSKRIKAEISG